MSDEERETIEREIVSARDGVGSGIDALDRKLRRAFDIESFASAHAEQLAVGGAVVGFLVGFGVPKLLRRVLQLGVPIALAVYSAKRKKKGSGTDANPSS
jgi:hypothetical protein